MTYGNKATRIRLFSFASPQMRAFHMSWAAFFLCFFSWFGIAPLMAVVRDEFQLSKAQVGNLIIASVAVTIVFRLLIGWLCDRIGPRLSYTLLLVLGSLPVMGIGLAQSYEAFVAFRLAIGAIGASFVITQYHTSVMFAPNVVGMANATTAGWGNLGGGVTQIVMPLVFGGFMALGFSESGSWRLSMLAAGIVCFLMGIAYFLLTQDSPRGNYRSLRRETAQRHSSGGFREVCRDRRVWALFLIYGACFGIELTINNIAALYFKDYFGLGLKAAGIVAGLFGLMNLFARSLGGFIGDSFGGKWGLKGRVRWLFLALAGEGVALIFFAQITGLTAAIVLLIVFSLFVQMSEGATYSVVPFINRKSLGSVTGIVGAGGNFGAVCAGFLFRAESVSWPQALLILGVIVSLCSILTFAIAFAPEEEAETARETLAAVAGAENPVLQPA